MMALVQNVAPELAISARDTGWGFASAHQDSKKVDGPCTVEASSLRPLDGGGEAARRRVVADDDRPVGGTRSAADGDSHISMRMPGPEGGNGVERGLR
jgi:hypothetical protein